MDKTHAINLLGGTVKSAAEAVGVTVFAIYNWPDPLTPRIADRVTAALTRMPKKRKPAKKAAA